MQNKPKAELTAALMLLDTRSMSFDMREIDNRRFMFSPQAGELILGRQYRGGQLYKSHAEEHFDSGAKAPFDSFTAALLLRGFGGAGAPALDALRYGFLCIIRAERFQTGKAFLPRCAARYVFTGLYLIARSLQQPQKIGKV